jgi:hypothetical protein
MSAQALCAVGHAVFQIGPSASYLGIHQGAEPVGVFADPRERLDEGCSQNVKPAGTDTWLSASPNQLLPRAKSSTGQRRPAMRIRVVNEQARPRARGTESTPGRCDREGGGG